MAAAKRLFLKAYGAFLIYVCGAIALAGILLGLQLSCMNKTQNSFVEEYCLSDNNMRAVVATVLTVTVWLMWTALADVICSFRTARLSVGIQEGAYVALGSMNYKYCWRCLKTRWCALVLLLVFLSYGPGMLQTVLSAVVKTVPVYVKSPSSAAMVFNHTSYYNVTDVSIPAADLGTATRVLSLLGQFAVGGNSVRDHAKRSTTTTLLRQGYISLTDIKDGNPSNAIRHSETTATLETTCPPERLLPGLITDYINSSTVMLTGPATEDGFLAAYLYDLQYAEIAHDHLVWYSTIVVCSNCAQNLDVIQAQQLYTLTCTTDMTLSNDDIIFTLGTQSIQKLPNTSAATTVNTAEFAELIVNASTSIEAASFTLANPSTRYTYNNAMLTLYSTFRPGVFNVAAASFLHSKICAAAAMSLDLLWTNYGISVAIVDGVLTVDVVDTNNFTLYDQFVPVYSVVQQAYMSTKVSVAFTVCLVLYIALLCAIGSFYTSRAHINVKSVRENSFFSCIDPESVQDMVAAGASNCEDAQLDLAFQPNRVMYCSAETVMLALNSAPVDRIKIGFLRGPSGVCPSNTTMYH